VFVATLLALLRAGATAVVAAVLTYLLTDPPCEQHIDGVWLPVGLLIAVPALAALLFSVPGVTVGRYLTNSVSGAVAVVVIGIIVGSNNTSTGCETHPGAWLLFGWIYPAIGTLVGLAMIVLWKDLRPWLTRRS
jgi:hypothetical protein